MNATHYLWQITSSIWPVHNTTTRNRQRVSLILVSYNCVLIGGLAIDPLRRDPRWNGPGRNWCPGNGLRGVRTCLVRNSWTWQETPQIIRVSVCATVSGYLAASPHFLLSGWFLYWSDVSNVFPATRETKQMQSDSQIVPLPRHRLCAVHYHCVVLSCADVWWMSFLREYRLYSIRSRHLLRGCWPDRAIIPGGVLLNCMENRKTPRLVHFGEENSRLQGSKTIFFNSDSIPAKEAKLRMKFFIVQLISSCQQIEIAIWFRTLVTCSG